MYQTYWNLNCCPFDDGADVRFYYPGQAHQTCLLKLRYVIEQKKGVGLLVGEHGTGKSYLSHVLEDELGDGNFRFLRLVIPQLSPHDLLKYFAAQLGVEVTETAPMNRTLQLYESTLKELSASGVHLVMVIDDAHLLSSEHLNVLRLMLNLRESNRADFTLLLLGRVELLAHVRRQHDLDQRISVRTSLAPLTVKEVREYVHDRTRVAGAQREIFHPNAAQKIWELSAGVPRRINQICDLALLVGFADHLQSLGPLEIQTAAEEITTVAA